jgi:hypothetical protein
MKKIFSFDVTLNDLESLKNNEFIKVEVLMEFLHTFWFKGAGDSDPDYLSKVRIGTMDVFLDDNNNLHLDFVTRFSLTNYPRALDLMDLLTKDDI